MDHPEYEYIVHDSILDMLQLLLERDDYMTCFCTQDTIKLPENVLQRNTYYYIIRYSNYCFIIPKSYQSLNPQDCNIFLCI